MRLPRSTWSHGSEATLQPGGVAFVFLPGVGDAMRRMHRILWIFLTVFAFLVTDPGSSRAEGFFLEGRGGVGGLSGDAGEAFEPGIVIAGLAGYELDGGVALEGEFSILIMDAESGDASLAFDAAGYLSILGGARVFLMPPEAPARLYLGGALGFSVLGWDYAPAGEALFGEDSDGVGAFSAMGKMGVRVAVSETVALGIDGRLIFNAWTDETAEGYAIDTDGASVQATAALTLLL